MMVQIHRHAGFFHGKHEFGAERLECVSGGNGEVAAFRGNLPAEILAIRTATFPPGFFAVNGIERFICAGRVADGIEDKEFRFGCEVNRCRRSLCS